MIQEKEDNLLKAKHYLKINKIEYQELNKDNHFRIFIPNTNKSQYFDFWPTTLKWQDGRSKLVREGIDSFILTYEKALNINKNKSQIFYSRDPEVIRDANTWMERYKTPGGWLVQSMHLTLGVLAMTFVPDSTHNWILEPPIKKMEVADTSKPLDKE